MAPAIATSESSTALIAGRCPTSQLHFSSASRNIHNSAVQANTASTVHSPRETRPSLRYSSKISSRPPGICFSFTGNSQRVSSHHARSRYSHERGVANSIQRPKVDRQMLVAHVAGEIDIGRRADQRGEAPQAGRVGDREENRRRQIGSVGRRGVARLSSSTEPKRLLNKLTTAIPIGSIITVVAVLLIHMLISPVASKNPPTSRLGLVPTAKRVKSRHSPVQPPFFDCQGDHETAEEQEDGRIGIRRTRPA